MKAYKGFDKDFKCRGFQYEVGKTYTHDGEIALCDSGFHFCKDLVLCFEFYPHNKDNRFAEVEVESDPIWDEVGHKGVATKITILREIPHSEIDALIDNPAKQNSGYRNSGYRNSGYRNSGNSNPGNSNSGNSNPGNWNSGNRNSGNSNSGNSNSGYRNSGDSNSGNWNSGNSNSGNSNPGNSNSGNWNACNFETGAFNTRQTNTIRAFNEPCDRTLWDDAYKPDFLYFSIGKGQTYKEAFVESWEKANPVDRIKVKALPNFDPDVFFEISGIRV